LDEAAYTAAIFFRRRAAQRSNDMGRTLIIVRTS